MFGIDKGADTALLLGFRHGLQSKRGLARGFRSVDLDDAAPGQAADAECYIEPQRAGRNRLDVERLAGSQLHDRTFAEGTFDLT